MELIQKTTIARINAESGEPLNKAPFFYQAKQG